MVSLRVPYTNFPAQFEDERLELMAAIERVMARGHFILGDEVEAFEREFAALCGTGEAVAVASGTDALLLVLKALGIGPGDEVITVPNSFIATVAPIVHVGARPLFVDVGEDLNIDPGRLESVITSRTRAVIPVHLAGRCADMAAVLTVAKRHGLHVIEDSAQAVGSELEGRRAGSFGVAAAFSLHPLKNLNAMGDAGIVATDDSVLAGELRLLRNHGLRTRDEVAQWGFNSRLDTIQAAALRLRLRRLPAVVARRRANAAQYVAALDGTVECPVERPREVHTYHLFVIQCDRRDELQGFLARREIETRVHYPVPIHLQPAAKDLGYRRGAFPLAERQAERILSLPVHQWLTPMQLDVVIGAILEFYGH